MKKFFLLSLSLVLGFSAFAQQRTMQRVMKNDVRQAVASSKKAAVGKDAASAANYAPKAAQSVVVNRYDNLEECEAMETTYDLQSNAFVANRMYQKPTGEVAVAATMSHEDNLVAQDRGTGYNFYDGSDWADQPDVRVEPFKTGWPSLSQWGENGEILLAHGNNHMQCFTRETAGEGDWTYMGNLPDYPEGYPYTSNYATWPRVVTCGDNHNIIIAVAALQQSVGSDETDVRTCFWRSEDAVNWTCSYGPIADLGLGYEIGNFSADDYALAANGHNVALIYSGCLTNSVWLFNSTDDGLTWTPTKVFEHPFEGVELDEEGLDYGDTLYMPMNSSIVIDNNGVTHVAMNTFEFSHFADTQAGYYTYFYGRAVDGILYWNSTMEAPIPSEDGNPFHAARLWWPAGEEYVRMHADSTKWIGFIPMYEGIDWNNDNFYNDNYHSKIYGASGHPALSCDPQGNLACAFSSPCTDRPGDGGFYHRSIYVSYRNVEEGYWHQVEDDLCDENVVLDINGECLFTNAVTNTVNDGEFWFSFQADDMIGFYWGSEPTQDEASSNVIYVDKVIASPEMVSVAETEAKDPVYGIYPNPVTGNVMNVKSAMEADATITVVNLVGQTVMQFNQHLNMGENSVSIDLKSGVYFCTINANGFNNTVKFVVK
ncbi:MAG: T9SS type A sorting domain-containing protein [Bacteroidales bacterium]|nr:T9SS type A sorting domain-containing protein [Bacteroidales bacterium]